MAIRSFEFILGAIFLASGAAYLLLHRFLAARFRQTLEREEVFNGITVLQFYFGIAVAASLIGAVLVLTALIAYARF